ncbi:MAG TPA: hypothetical protein VGG83_07265 [Trebonia sp.]|jgi:hypothetical protein
MITTLPATAPGADKAIEPARRPVGHRTPRRAARRVLLHTPAKLRGLLALLVLLSLAWGAFGGWVAIQHSSAANSLVSVNERLTLDSRQMYQALADADATITAAFLASDKPPLSQLQRYRADLATAEGDLSGLQAAGGSPTIRTALARLVAGLPAYNGDIGEATAEYAMGFPLTGGSFLQVASDEAHLVLLPAASTVFTRQNAALKAASGQATELPLVIAAVALALVTAFVLFRAQRWLSRRTNRVLSPGLVLASLLLAVSVIWLVAAFFTARSDLERGISQGDVGAYDLAFASIGVQQIRGDAVLNLISRDDGLSFQDNFEATSKKTGPGPGSWLTEAAAAQPAVGPGASLVATAERDATAWYAVNSEGYRLDTADNFPAERTLVTGTAAAGYTALASDLTKGIQADQDVFDSAASSGASTLDPLEGVVIAASLLMAAGCAWAVSRRLAEYR